MESGKEKDWSSGGFRKSLRPANEFVRAHHKILIGASLVFLTIAVYLPALDSLMVADDFLIVDRWGLEDAVRSLHDTVGFGRNEYRPVIAFSYAISNLIWRGALRGYHLDSILAHTAAVVLLYLWLLLLTRSAAISGIAAALFAVHPIQHERVIWITARDSLFSMVFSLLALIAYTMARRKDENESVPSASSPKILLSLSAVFFILSLLSYEGAAVVPIIMAALEFFVFSQPKQKLWRRLRFAAVKTRWHLLILLIHVVWWALLFRGEVGLYFLSYTAGNLLHNYYSYLYHLFHGNSRLAGVLYFILLVSAFFLPRERRPLAAFSLSFMLIAYIPFVFIPGFADRFAYAGAAGFVALIALLIYACTQMKAHSSRSFLFIGPPLALIIFVILAGYYIISTKSRISDWLSAGQIADSIPRQIKILHPDLPNGSRLVLAHIPPMHGHAYVYPIGSLEFSIARFYPGRSLQVIYGPDEIDRIMGKSQLEGTNYLLFNYLPDKKAIEEIK